MPALPPYLIEPIWQQFSALLPEREVYHPLGCHRRRIPDRVVFEKLIEVLVFGCAYHRIADEECSATTLRDRRDEWIEAGVIEELRKVVLEAYDRYIGLELSDTVPVCWWHNEGMPKILYPQVITEDPHELKELEKQHRYTHLFQRVRML